MSLTTISDGTSTFRNSLAGLSVCSVLLLGACSASPTPSPAATSSTIPTITGGVDMVGYSSTEQLAQDSLFAFEGRVVESRGVWITPIYEGVDPWLNPLAGIDRAPSPDELQAASVPATEFDVVVTNALNSPFIEGDKTSVRITGGEVDGVMYSFDSVSHLEVGDTYLLFVHERVREGIVTVTGVSAGVFSRDASGNYRNAEGLSWSAEEVSALHQPMGHPELSRRAGPPRPASLAWSTASEVDGRIGE